MDKYEHRRLRLRELIAHTFPGHGGQARFAAITGIDASYVSRMLYEATKNGRKRIKDDIIEKTRNALGLPPGWFDMPLGSHLPLSSNTGTSVVGAQSRLPDSQRSAPDGKPADAPHQHGDVHEIPILTYGDIMDGKYKNTALAAQERQSTRIARDDLGENCFAVRARDDSMDGGIKPISRGMVVIIDPDAKPHHGSVVLIHEPHCEPMLRQYWKEGTTLLSRATAGGLPPRPLDPSHVIGVARRAVVSLDLDE